MAKLKVVHKWVGWVESRVSCFILGRVGLGQVTCGSGWVGSRKLDPHPTLPRQWGGHTFSWGGAQTGNRRSQNIDTAKHRIESKMLNWIRVGLTTATQHSH